MKHWLVKHYQIFQNHPDWYFFYAFLITFPLSVRKIIYFYTIAGQYNEFTAISLYLSDILLLMTLITWGYLLFDNKLLFLSIGRYFIQAIKSPFIYLPLILSLTSFISIVWADYQAIAIYRSIKLFEFILLYYYVYYQISRLSSPESATSVEHLLSRGTFVYYTFWLIFGMGFILAIIGIFQFTLQHSIGLFLIKESYVSQSLPGVAKISIFGKTLIRAYSLFPHPNVFSGFLLFSIVSGVILKNLFHACPVVSICSTPIDQFMFHVEHKLSTGHAWNKNNVEQTRINDDNNTINKNSIFVIAIFNINSYFIKLQSLISETLILTWNFVRPHIISIISLVLILSLILTFSKSAWLGLIGGLLYAIYVSRSIVSRYISNTSRNLIFPLFIFIILIIAIFREIFPSIMQSYDERLAYLKPAIGIISNSPLFGIGMGQFVPHMEQFSSLALDQWQFQPVHNVFLLVWSELGLIGFLSIILIIFILLRDNSTLRLSKIVPRGTIFGIDGQLNFDLILKTYLKSMIIGFIVIMLFDHYFWDIQQGQIIFWLVLGLLAGIISIEKEA